MVDMTADPQATLPSQTLPSQNPASQTLPTTQWFHRRVMIYGALVFIGFSLAYLLLLGNDESRLHETLAFGLMTGGFGIISSYVFGAVWNDKNLLALKR